MGQTAIEFQWQQWTFMQWCYPFFTRDKHLRPDKTTSNHCAAWLISSWSWGLCHEDAWLLCEGFDVVAGRLRKFILQLHAEGSANVCLWNADICNLNNMLVEVIDSCNPGSDLICQVLLCQGLQSPHSIVCACPLFHQCSYHLPFLCIMSSLLLSQQSQPSFSTWKEHPKRVT